MRRIVLPALGAALLPAACGPKKYVLLSPEDDYSDDASLSLQVETIHETVKGRIEVTALLENKGTAALPIGEATVVLLDSKDKEMPILAKPSDAVPPGEEKKLVWAFDTKDAAKGSLEMRLVLEGKKIWPILFSPDKPSDFSKPLPDGGPMGQQPPGGGRPPF
jgi:hypothetical protein